MVHSPCFGKQVTSHPNPSKNKNCWIGRYGVAARSPRSRDLIPFDYSPWGLMKSLAYSMNSRSRVDLLRRAIDGNDHF